VSEILAFPLLHIEWHEGHGFVIQCYEDAHAWSDFLVSGVPCGPPTIEINLGGQALERWPTALFVPEELAGPPVGAAVGALFPKDYPQYSGRLGPAIGGAAAGLLLGVLVGGLLPNRAVVYRPGAEAALSIVPVPAPGRSGAVFYVGF
jgi:hypothetical protein